MRKQILLYMPVLHAGYEALLDRHPDADEILLMGYSFREKFRSLQKDIRALDPHHAAQYLRERYRAQQIWVVEVDALMATIAGNTVVLPEDALMEQLFQEFRFPEQTRIVRERVFLRWDSENSLRPSLVERVETCEISDMERLLMEGAVSQSEYSSDWWRQVGALIAAKGGFTISSYNRHLPTDHAPYFNGDPRANFKKGVHIELSTALHAEAGAIAEAARQGIGLEGAKIFTTTFPCPGCARLIAASGITKCYYSDEYAVLDGEEVLRTAGVELIWVDMKNPSSA